MKEYKWSVGLRHKATGERLKVRVWAPTNDGATHKLIGSLIGPECEYDWVGTGPVHESNQTAERDVQTEKLPDVKCPLTDELKELTADALAELAQRLELEASVYQQMNTHDGRLLADDRVERAAVLKEAADYYLYL